MPTSTLNEQQKATRSRENTRERLFEAALSVFAEHGVHGSSIEMITEAADFTRGAFYSNFASKDELFFALAEREVGKTLQKLRDTINSVTERFSTTDNPDLTTSVIQALVGLAIAGKFADARWYIVQAEFKLFALRDRSVAKRFLDSQRKFAKEIADFVREALDTLDLESKMDIDIATQIIINTFMSALEEATLLDRKNVLKSAQQIAMRSIPDLVSAITQPKAKE